MSLIKSTRLDGSSDLSGLATAVLEHLQEAWNAGDGAAFAAPFTPDATFVNVHGELVDGPDIGPGHDRLLAGVYAGSSVTYRLLRARPIAEGVVVVHFHASLEVPAGPAAGSRESLASFVATTGPGGWRLAAFHNTYIA